MAKGRFTPEEMEILRQNENVIDVTETRITYSNSFKEHFMIEYLLGKGPTSIFRESGFDSKIVGEKRIERSGARWRDLYGVSLQDRCNTRSEAKRFLKKAKKSHDKIKAERLKQAKIDRIKKANEEIKEQRRLKRRRIVKHVAV